MIITELHDGQGLGNQLWCYIATRVIAKDKGYDFGIKSPERFKGDSFMDIDFGKPVEGIRHRYSEQSIIHPLNRSDIRTYDEKLVNVPDRTEIEGYMQDERYIAHRKGEIRQWLSVRKAYDCTDYSGDDICVINFRGGGYIFDVDFFLPRRYWKNAIALMRAVNPSFRFIVVTDDVKTARRFFPNFEVFHWSIGKDYSVIKNAHYLILSNSSFAWFPAWTSTRLKYCIAPKYWGRHNISDGFWSLGYNVTKGWMYLDRKGNLYDYDQCIKELDQYMLAHKGMYATSPDGSTPARPVARGIRNIWNIFNTIRKDTSAVYAFGWIVRTRGLRGAIWIKDRMDALCMRALKISIFKLTKNVKRIAKKILHLRETIPELIDEYRTKKTWHAPEEIAEYRKKIKIYDIFTFFNELDLLEIRLSILDPYVDFFVIVEASETHSGRPKPLYFKENEARFEKWKHKIIYLAVTNIPKSVDDMRRRLSEGRDLAKIDRHIMECLLSVDNADTIPYHWIREGYIKESVRKALVGLDDNDICYVSDLDEIWNPELLIDYSSDDIFKLRQKGYMYYLNNRSDEHWSGWTGTIVTKYKNIKDGYLDDLKRRKKTRHVILSDGGWHFTFQGGLEGARRKLNESDHPFYGTPETIKKIDIAVENNYDYKGRNVKLWVSERGLPRYLMENKERYREFFKRNGTRKKC